MHMPGIHEVRARAANLQHVTGRGLPASVVLVSGIKTRDAYEGVRDARRLQREHPRLVPSGAPRPALKAAHDRYLAEVSPEGWAVSWESVRFLRELCETVRPRRVLDLGSGFSSLVMREYAAAAGHDVVSVSVDDAPAWLERTREFLEQEGRPSGELRAWSDFEADPGEPYDVIFHDLAIGETRERAMPVAVRALAPRGVIVFDDIQDFGHRVAALRASREGGLATYSLYRWTRDRLGRFAMLASP